MSLGFTKNNIVKVMNEEVNFEQPVVYAIEQGAMDVSYRPSIATSFSNSSITFSNNVPNSQVGISRLIYLSVPFRLVFTGPDNGVPLLNIGSTDSLRFCPLQNVCVDNMQLKINNTTINQNVSDYFEPCMRYLDEDTKRFMFSSAPNFQDTYQEYSSAVGAFNNPLGGYANSGYQLKRGAFEYDVISNTNTSAEVLVTVIEPLVISPLVFQKNSRKALINVESLDFTFSLSNLNRIWSHSNAGGSVISNLQVSVQASPQLFFKFMSPILVGSGSEVPKSIDYQLSLVDRYPTNVGSVPAGSTFSATAQNIQFNSIPSSVYIYCRERESDRTYNTTDTYARIDSMNISFNNQSGILSGCSPHDLYKISQKNGLQYSFYEWREQIGSVLKLDFDKDISLNSDLASGVLGNFQMIVQLTGKNLNTTRAINFDLFIVAVQDGVLNIQKRLAVQTIGNLTREDVLTSRELEVMPEQLVFDEYGGSFLSKLKEGTNLIKKYGKKYAPVVLDNIRKYGPMALEVGEQLLPLLLAMGYDEKTAKQIVKGQGLKGGKLVSAAQKRKMKSRFD